MEEKAMSSSILDHITSHFINNCNERYMEVECFNTINNIKFDLHRATLDHEVITSPENISRLAKIHLENTFSSYKKSQIKTFGKNSESKKFTKILNQTTENKSKLKLILAKKVEKKKTELMKLQQLYTRPNELPGYEWWVPLIATT